MKNIFKLMLLLLLALPFQACSDDDEAIVATLEVTPNNLAGIWKLHAWSGSNETLPTVYIEFFRKDKKFKIYQTYNSMYPEIKTGTYSLESDDYKGDILKGKYDYGTGGWNNDYIVKALTQTTLELVADAADAETQTFVRVSEVPAEIIDNLPSMDEVDN